MGKPTPMDREAADRISRTAWERPDSYTTRSGWDGRAQGAADKNEGYVEPIWDDDEDDE
ncbi:hypothetical protein [Frankia sp. R43]|uniref:hypothetical protein n=1 Tax=Frankia sp. R43 TaxID=269536 RepID=UPI000B1FAA60|nr:hypothetical protein [Frankia sp. R43]